MKHLLTAVALLVAMATADIAWAQQQVDGYFRKDGTYVQPYTRSTPNKSYNDNYSVRGNTNPYTGERGTKSPTFNDRTPDYNRRTYGDPGYTGGRQQRRY